MKNKFFDFFDLEKPKKPLFLVHFPENYCALLRMDRVFDLEERIIAQNDRNTIISENMIEAAKIIVF